MANIMICFACLNMVAFLPNPTTYSLVIMWTVASNHLKRFACFWPTKSNIQKISFCSEAITNVPALTVFTAFMMNVNDENAIWQLLGKRRYNIKLWKTFTECFNCMPVAAIIDEKIFCMHGGLSPDLHNMDQIRKVIRPTDVPDSGLLCDLLWSDVCCYYYWYWYLYLLFISQRKASRAGVTMTVCKQCVYILIICRWCIIYLWWWCCWEIFEKAWFGFGLSCTSSCGRWIQVFCQATIGHRLFSTQLLQRIWQCRSVDECGWQSHVQFQHSQASTQEEGILLLKKTLHICTCTNKNNNINNSLAKRCWQCAWSHPIRAPMVATPCSQSNSIHRGPCRNATHRDIALVFCLLLLVITHQFVTKTTNLVILTAHGKGQAELLVNVLIGVLQLCQCGTNPKWIARVYLYKFTKYSIYTCILLWSALEARHLSTQQPFHQGWLMILQLLFDGFF